MLSIAFLQGALKARGGLAAGAITSVSVLDQGETGSGAIVARLALTYDAAAPADAPRRLIAKIAKGEAAAPARRELRFYRLAAPSLPTVIYPRLLGAAAGFETGQIVLLFEDLAAAGLSQVDGSLGDTVLAALAVRLAVLHAVHWDAWPSACDFSEPMESSTRSAQASPPSIIAANAASGAEAMATFIAAFGGDLSENQVDFLRRVMTDWGEVMSIRAAAGALTLIHGDFHLTGNIFTGPADEIRVIDWSELKPGLGPHDLAYALVSQPAVDRATQDRALLQIYVQELAARGVAGYGFDQALWDYRFSLVTNLFQSARQMNPVWMGKTLVAIEALDAAQTLSGWRGAAR